MNIQVSWQMYLLDGDDVLVYKTQAFLSRTWSLLLNVHNSLRPNNLKDALKGLSDKLCGRGRNNM